MPPRQQHPTIRLNSGLVGILIKFRRAVVAKGENSIHLQREMTGVNELSRTEYCVPQQLRYFGLIAHVTEDGVRKRGYWLLTKRGRQFLDGEVSVPQMVRILNNHIHERGAVYVTVTEAFGTKPVWDDIDFWQAGRERVAFDMAQAEMTF